MAYTLSEVTESIGTITLDHERRRNKLSHALVEQVISALQAFQEANARVGSRGPSPTHPRPPPQQTEPRARRTGYPRIAGFSGGKCAGGDPARQARSQGVL